MSRAIAPVDQPVAIVTRDNVSLVPAVLGVVKAGHFFVMIDAADPDERTALLLRESSAALCVSDTPVPAGLREHEVVVIPGRPPSTPPVLPPRDPHPLLHIVFTSGTTGKPKAVLTPQEGYVEKALTNGARIGRVRGERCAYTVLPGFTRATNAIFQTLLAGATLCAFEARNDSLVALAESIARERITVLILPPSLYRSLMTVAPENFDLSSVTKVNVSADTVTMADVAAFKAHFPPGCTLEIGYGSTEAGMVCHMSIAHDTHVPGPLVPIGRPWPGVDVRLVDDDGNEVPVGEIGEMVVRSAQVIDSYWNAEEVSAKRIAADPMDPTRRICYTGDLARRDHEGLFYFLGRSDSRLKIHDRRVDPLEVEAALLATGELSAAAVVGKRDAAQTLRLVAYVVVARDGVFAPRALRASLRSSVPAWMVPARIFPIEAIPTTAAGKVDRAALVARVDDHRISEDGATTDLERALVAIWSRVIGTAVHVHDDFFDDLGGESLIAAQLVSEVEKATGRTIPISLLIDLNTVAKMAGYVRSSKAAPGIVVALRAGGSLPPLFCASGIGGSALVFRPLATALGDDQPVYGLHHHAFEPGAFPTSIPAMAAVYADAIQAVQPAGPYHLTGYSIGGQLAFEIARQITHRGEIVAFVGLIESTAGTTPVSWRQRLRNRIELLRQRPIRKTLAFAREAFVRPGMWFRRRFHQVLVDQYGERYETLPAWLHQMADAYAAAHKGFVLMPYGGTVTLFRARNGIARIRREADLGWGRVRTGRLDIIDVDGDHPSVLTTDVASLAAALTAALAAARAAQ
jgi:acyl-CoA synthetase (AMP-forming)/AMP-acid ligase II/thioesterase domain-containing protein/acyl carrier protein